VAIAGSEGLGAPLFGADPSVPKPLTLLGAWDTSWYLGIARHGYDPSSLLVGELYHYTNFAFFPLLPAVMSIGIWTSTNPFLWGWVVSNLAFLGALAAFHRLSWDRRGLEFANRATWVLALSPAAVYASLAYTDGILIGLATGAALAATRGRWYLAGAATAAAALVRPQGILVGVLVVAIAMTAAETPRWVRVRHAAIGGLPALAALGGFLGWLQVARGSWDLPQKAEGAWGRAPLGLGALRQVADQAYNVVAHPLTHAAADVGQQWSGPVRDLLATVAMMLLLFVLWRSEGTWRSPWAIFATLAVFVPFLSGSIDAELRFGLLAFPLVWPVTDWIFAGRARVRWVTPAALIVMAALVLQLHWVFP